MILPLVTLSIEPIEQSIPNAAGSSEPAKMTSALSWMEITMCLFVCLLETKRGEKEKKRKERDGFVECPRACECQQEKKA